MQTNELREKYLAFFETKGHTRVASDVLVPTWDPSVLFTPAGMNQFKDHFLGKVKLEYTRATTCQKCMRTGDIDNVGRTPRHHTFFEMLGNFSFGDYFKDEAIHWAWEFLTDKKWLGLPAETLSVTVYKDDQEAADIWHEKIGLPTSRISFEKEDENFWPASAPSQGPDGVCGPCSEIYYTAPGREALEIWNLVFTQFNRVGDPPDNLRPLPSKNIDTGMGLERTAAALQNVETNFHIDILMPIVKAAAEVCGVEYKYDSENGRRIRRITDHVRACTFAVHENVYPGANKEKYVVKRLLRRAVLDGHQMGLRDPFLSKIVPAVVDAMGGPYPELKETVERVAGVIEKEEANFFSTIDGGLNRIDLVFDEMRKDNRTTVDGHVAADLYQTYGVPPELFESLAAEHNLAFDWKGYHEAMDEHGVRSGTDQKIVMGSKGPIDSLKKVHHKTEFLGYEITEAEATVVGIVAGKPGSDQLCDKMEEVGHEDPVRVVLDKTPFYGESGGQVGDVGKLVGKGFEFEVIDTQKDGELFIHLGHLKSGVMSEGDTVTATVDTSRRAAIQRAHSATHLLHHALHKHLGDHAQQQGSKVDADWLRFDFTNLSPVEPEKLAAIAEDVAADVATAAPVKWETLPLADARKQGAMMLFGEKYPDPVRMVSMGPLSAGTNSRELCGGTHLTNTSEVGAFEIISEEGVSSGTRRIVALTGQRAEEQATKTVAELEQAAKLLEVDGSQVAEAVGLLLNEQRSLKKLLSSGGQPSDETTTLAAKSAAKLSYQQAKLVLAEAGRLLSVAPLAVVQRVESLVSEVESIKKQLAERDATGPLSADKLLESAKDVTGTTVVIAETPGAPQNLMRQLIDTLRAKCDSVAVMLAAREGDDKVTLIAGISKDLQDKGVSAGKWISPVAKALGGGGGGRPDMAQAGGKKPEELPAALEVAEKTITEMLGA
ncbi:alanine--tRNA ligase [Aeoliella mucimassa]|uniref:Alanine--tRNA ligase n=1 Tax=Aeoliella mucimassa TaxID=2527972 RepID=A0A518AKH9_9BACT|nr:alanine--tRNA ligase [Aeoliella mucimassa]QDU55184.1 Alanine--tRNA ligase [Aeoliella mucimassa]